MKKKLCILAAMLLAFLAPFCAAAFLFYASPAHTAAQEKTADAPLRASASDLHISSGTLFPGMNPDLITAVSVHTPENGFEFCLDENGNVSINGRRGDGEIFLTLLEQIEEFPVREHSAFTGDTPALTLSVRAADAHYTARFYPGDRKDAPVRIVYDARDGRQYRQTEAWRMGTLLMTCEGVRIQDERGNELPAD